MKTLQLSAIALCLFGMFSSCTKDTLSSQDSLASATRNGNQNENNPPGQGVTPPGQDMVDNSSNGNDDVAPVLTITYDPAIGTLGLPVKVTGTFDMLETDQPTCGKLQLQQQQPDGSFITVAQKNVTNIDKEVEFTFTPNRTDVNDVAAYNFQLHYVKGGCSGFATSMSDVFPLHVRPACTGLSIKGVATAVKAEGNLYLFTVTYTVNPCGLEFTKLKTQGGLTNGVEQVTSVGGLNRIPGHSTNRVITWEELSSTGDFLSTTVRTYVVTFKKPYSGSGDIEITGKWSVSAEYNGEKVGYAEFLPITYPQP